MDEVGLRWMKMEKKYMWVASRNCENPSPRNDILCRFASGNVFIGCIQQERLQAIVDNSSLLFPYEVQLQ